MTHPQPQPNEVLDVGPLADKFSLHKTGPIFSSDQFKVMRLILPAGKVVAEHQAPGEITVHCLEGRVAFTAVGKTQELAAGHLLFLTAREPHAVEALEDSSLLVTIALSN